MCTHELRGAGGVALKRNVHHGVLLVECTKSRRRYELNSLPIAHRSRTLQRLKMQMKMQLKMRDACLKKTMPESEILVCIRRNYVV